MSLQTADTVAPYHYEGKLHKFSNLSYSLLFILGIGKALVKAFVDGKAEKVFGLSNVKAHLDELVAELPCVQAVMVDLCDWNATKAAVEKLGPIDILVNNAGVYVGELLVDVKPESFDSYVRFLMYSRRTARNSPSFHF